MESCVAGAGAVRVSCGRCGCGRREPPAGVRVRVGQRCIGLGAGALGMRMMQHET